MAKIILSFIVLFVIFYFGITALRSMSGKEKWALTKLVTYSILCTVLTTLVLTAFVLLF
jgi:hypothetical protein